MTQDELIFHVAEAKRNGRRVVFTSGAFDLLHPGHLRLLEDARGLGDVLVVAVAGDAAVRQAKGPGRPVAPAAERAEVLAALAAVDYVTVLDEAAPRELLARLRPDWLVLGSDEPPSACGAAEVEAAGGRVVAVPRAPGGSATEILERIRSLPLQP